MLATFYADIGLTSDARDHEAAKGNVLGLALTCQLRQPQIYIAQGMDRPPNSILVFEADHCWSHGMWLAATYHLSKPNSLGLLLIPRLG